MADGQPGAAAREGRHDLDPLAPARGCLVAIALSLLLLGVALTVLEAVAG